MTTDSTAIFHRLTEAPDGALIVQKFNEHLVAEARRREQFYQETDETVKTEFINGEVILHSPVTRGHSLVVARLSSRLVLYVGENRLGEVHIEKAMVRLTRNDYEPDICFFSTAKAAAFTDDQKLFPPPDLVVEVLSKSTAKNDRGLKFVDYAAHGVVEYWIIDPKKKIVEQYVNRGGAFEQLVKAKGQSEVRSVAVEGFGVRAEELFV